MTDHVHDCIVVGAGPAGSAAALQMARDGLDVVLLERGAQPGEKNVMSGVLVTDKLRVLIPDFRDRAPLQRCITGGYNMYILGEDEVLHLPSLRNYRRSKYPHPPFTVFRSEFDAWFAQEAVNAGVELFTATLVEDLLWEDGRVAGVHTARGDLRARVVIGADGINSTVAERSELCDPPSPTHVSLIVREILDLPTEQIEERFALRPGEGVLSLFIGPVLGPTRVKSVYFTEMYTNRDSLSLTAEVPLDVLQACSVPTYEVLAARERHPYISRLIQGATLREYQAHLIPRGGIADLDRLYGDGVLLTGDAGRFVDKNGVGSFPAMASGVAAARAVKYACKKGDFSKKTLAIYQELLDEEGLVDSQRQSRQAWEHRQRQRPILTDYPDRLLHIAERYSRDWMLEEKEHAYSLEGEIYYELVRPLAPWYVRCPLGLAAWIDTWRWRQR